jgi:hypothetical protein
VNVEAAGAFHDHILHVLRDHDGTPAGRLCEQSFCCVLPWMGATDGGAFRRPRSSFLRAHGTKSLDLSGLPWSSSSIGIFM